MNYSKELKDPIFRLVQSAADESNLPTFVVGGWVRDLLLNKKQTKTDIDFVCVGSGIALAKKVCKKLGKGAILYRFKNFGTAMIDFNGENYEFVGARTESYSTDSRKPIVEEGSLQDDLNRRDFTINAIAIELNQENFGTLIDPFNGQTDLNNKIIRTPLNPTDLFG